MQGVQSGARGITVCKGCNRECNLVEVVLSVARDVIGFKGRNQVQGVYSNARGLIRCKGCNRLQRVYLGAHVLTGCKGCKEGRGGGYFSNTVFDQKSPVNPNSESRGLA